MKNRTLYILWAAGFALCAALGFISPGSHAVRVLLFLLALSSFVPPALLLIRAVNAGDVKAKLQLRLISGIWLALTLILALANLFSVNLSQLWGNILYGLLVVLSSPMVCGQLWLVSLFLWSCLFFGTFHKRENP